MNISSILIIITCAFYACQIIDHEKNSRFLSGVKTPPSCADFPQNPLSRCIGCQEAKRENFPWHVEVTDAEKIISCGGTLISPKIVLTSGSCVKVIGLEELKIISGQFSRSKEEPGEKISKVSQRILHPNCCHNATNIALLGLKQSLELSKFIQFACINGAIEPNDGTTVITAGWGSIVECARGSKCKYPDNLQATELQVISREQCKKELAELDPVYENMISKDYICAKDDASGLCKGDYGGSLIEDIDGKATVVGLYLWTDSKCRIKYPGVFTNVAEYLQWIKDTMKIIKNTTPPPTTTTTTPPLPTTSPAMESVLKILITYTADEDDAGTDTKDEIYATIRSKKTSCETNSLDTERDDFERNN